MPTPHKHAELIKKWADDFSLEFEFLDPKAPEEGWSACTTGRIGWFPNLQYRIKPKLVKREGWMLVSPTPDTRYDPGREREGYMYENSFIYTDERDVPKQLGRCKDFVKIKVEWEEEV